MRLWPRPLGRSAATTQNKAGMISAPGLTSNGQHKAAARSPEVKRTCRQLHGPLANRKAKTPAGWELFPNGRPLAARQGPPRRAAPGKSQQARHARPTPRTAVMGRGRRGLSRLPRRRANRKAEGTQARAQSQTLTGMVPASQAWPLPISELRRSLVRARHQFPG